MQAATCTSRFSWRFAMVIAIVALTLGSGSAGAANSDDRIANALVALVPLAAPQRSTGPR